MPTPVFSAERLGTVFPEFRGFRHMASGGFKSVYQVSRSDGDRDEVLKIVCLPIPTQNEEGIALHAQELGRVQRETAVLRGCESPYVVKLGRFTPRIAEIDGARCYAYTEELLEGSDLAAVIALSTRPQPAANDVRTLLRCLVSAIQVLWRDQRIVHRDIKPANIFCTRDGARPYVLIDLGIAYDVTVPGLTVRPENIPHTPLYIPPEMLRPAFRENLSYRSDLYAAGVCAYEYAASEHPLTRRGDDPRQTYTRVLQQEPRSLAELRPDLPASLCALIHQLLKKDPALRPANLTLLLNQVA